MSRKSKLLRFAELDSFKNCYQGIGLDSSLVRKSDESFFQAKGNWSVDIFNNKNPLIVELACGKGEYTVALAEAHPDINFIGIDIKGNRMHRGAKKALALSIHHAAFLRIRIEWIMNYFAENELAEIWITFPDPFLKHSKANRRLTSPMFLDKYKVLLRKEGIVHLKTDSEELFKYTVDTIGNYHGIKVIQCSENIDQDNMTTGDLAIQTYYEGMHRALGKPIKYISWKYVSII